jgi:hypothetical protein
MKTPIQELIEQLKEERDGFMSLPPHSNIQDRTANCFGSCIEIAERMLEKEKQMIIDAFDEGCDIGHDIGSNHDYHEGHNQGYDYYNETFNIKEK